MIIDELRIATRVQHRALEADLAVLDPQITLEALRSTLIRFYGFIAAWEPLVRTYLASWYSDREKLRWLRDDLAFLGLTDAQIAQLPVAVPLPEWDGFAGILGSLYVMEGSTLGGQIVARHLAETLGPESPLSYYRAYGDQTGLRWRETRELLESQNTPGRAPQIVRGAVATFEGIHRWLLEAPALKEEVPVA